MLSEQSIFDFVGNQYSFSHFLDQIKKYHQFGFNLYVGSDSKIVKNKILLVTVMCFHKPGSSGKIFYFKDRIARKLYPNLKSRMFLEAYRSLETAQELQSLTTNKIEVHLDVGDTIRSKTSDYEQELQAMITSQGFACVIKPDSFASSACADKVVRGF